MTYWAASLAAKAIERLIGSEAGGRERIATVLSSVSRYPVKALAVFFTAPFLAFRVARFAKDPTRRLIASVGLVLSVIAAWIAGTLLGTLAGALLIAAKVGLVYGLAFFVGTALSVTLSATFSILILNATACFFLKISSQEVVDHLKAISE